MDHLLTLKTKYGHGRIHWSVNLLRFPSFQSCLALPAEIRTERKLHLEKWLNEHKVDPRLHEMEVASLQRLVDYLDVVKTPHQDSSPREELERDFKKFFQQFDVRRNKDFRKSFASSPELISWYDNIKT